MTSTRDYPFYPRASVKRAVVHRIAVTHIVGPFSNLSLRESKLRVQAVSDFDDHHNYFVSCARCD